MTAAVVYMRCSSRGQDSGDTWDRQLAAVKLYAETHNIEIVDEYRDVITGKTDLDDRPGLAACLERVENNGVKLVLIESADRLARDAMVLELSIREFKKYGATVMTASGVNLTEGGDDNPTAGLIRGILALIAEFDRRVIVLKLRAARQRQKAKNGRCEGIRPFGTLPREAETLRFIIGQHRCGVKSEDIAERLNFNNFPSRSGKPWRASVIRKIIARNRVSA